MLSLSILRCRAVIGSVLAAAVAAVVLSAGAASASATPVTWFVDPVHGTAGGTGASDHPMKQISQALDRAHAGDTVRLAGGQYSADTNGERYKNFYGEPRLRVPAGVTLIGEADPTRGRTILVGKPGEVGLMMDGDGAVRTMLISGFDIGLRADRGTQNLVGVDFSHDGINLAGSAKLTYGTSVPDPLPTERGGIFTDVEEPAFRLHSGAQLTMTGGVIKGKPGVCDTSQRGIDTTQASTGVDVSHAKFLNLAGGAVISGAGTQATLVASRIENANPAGCTPLPAVNVLPFGYAQLNGTTVVNTGTRAGAAIQDASTEAVVVVGGSTLRNWGAGIKTVGAVANRIFVENSTIDGSSFGIDAAASTAAKVTVTGSKIVNGLTGIEAAIAKIRGTQITGNAGTGVIQDGLAVDLGTTADPGHNVLQRNGSLGSVRVKSGLGAVKIIAIGNTWNPLVQGADESGFYPPFAEVTSQSPFAVGTNFRLDAGQSIVLG